MSKINKYIDHSSNNKIEIANKMLGPVENTKIYSEIYVMYCTGNSYSVLII